MHALEKLIARAGSWRGTNVLQDPMESEERSETRATVTPLLGGSFVRIDYTWDYKGDPQEGSFLIGLETDTDTLTAAWVDTWHNADRMMICRGEPGAGAGGSIGFKGEYGAPEGPPWGWRTEIHTDPGLRIVMYNVTPDGDEALAVEATFDDFDTLDS
jgi:hypothetical protein